MEREGTWLTKCWAALNRYKFVLLVIAAGAVLLLWPGTGQTAERHSSDAAAITTAAPGELESAMEKILGKMAGVGRVEVLLTLQSGSELVLAQDTVLRYSGSVQAPEDYERNTETVTNAGANGVVVTQENYPVYRGALVVCDGGGSDAVRLKVAEAVSALTGLGTDRIAVVQWGAAGESKA